MQIISFNGRKEECFYLLKQKRTLILFAYVHTLYGIISWFPVIIKILFGVICRHSAFYKDNFWDRIKKICICLKRWWCWKLLVTWLFYLICFGGAAQYITTDTIVDTTLGRLNW